MDDLTCSYLGFVDISFFRGLSLNTIQGILGRLTKLELIFSKHLNAFLLTGDDPPRDRTGELRVMGFPTRHLGPVQMTTDTALGVTKLVVKDKVPLDKISYIVRPQPFLFQMILFLSRFISRISQLSVSIPKSL